MYASDDSEDETEPEATGRSSGSQGPKRPMPIPEQKVKPVEVKPVIAKTVCCNFTKNFTSYFQPQQVTPKSQAQSSTSADTQVFEVPQPSAKEQAQPRSVQPKVARPVQPKPEAQSRTEVATLPPRQDVPGVSSAQPEAQALEVEGERFRVLETFLAEQPGDLDIQKGEILKILAVR